MKKQLDFSHMLDEFHRDEGRSPHTLRGFLEGVVGAVTSTTSHSMQDVVTALREQLPPSTDPAVIPPAWIGMFKDKGSPMFELCQEVRGSLDVGEDGVVESGDIKGVHWSAAVLDKMASNELHQYIHVGRDHTIYGFNPSINMAACMELPTGFRSGVSIVKENSTGRVVEMVLMGYPIDKWIERYGEFVGIQPDKTVRLDAAIDLLEPIVDSCACVRKIQEYMKDIVNDGCPLGRKFGGSSLFGGLFDQ